MPTQSFILNGNRVSVDCADNVRLLWVLRDLLGVKGPKYGCGLDACHACTSHINGKAFRPCSVEVSKIKHHDHITTIEGLPATAGAELHPMQQAWIDYDVAQCGYCQPGQIMAAVALVEQVQAEGREINQADLDTIRNVCRCGTYIRIREAITSATPTPGCPLVSGTLRGERLGKVKLGMTRAQARRAFAKSKKTSSAHIDSFCLTPAGVRVGYATPAVLKTLPEHERAKYEGRVIWASTTSTFYSLHGVRAGTTLKEAHRLLKLTGPLHVGAHAWYLAPNGASAGVLKVHKNIVEEIGIGEKALTKTHHEQVAFLGSFR
jgi:isoquinoline 1-oxidoreductase alpha subunit